MFSIFKVKDHDGGRQMKIKNTQHSFTQIENQLVRATLTLLVPMGWERVTFSSATNTRPPADALRTKLPNRDQNTAKFHLKSLNFGIFN